MLRKITILAVFLFCLAVPVLATDVTISSTQIRYWDGPTSGVELRLNLDQSIVTPQQQNFPANAVVVKVACTVASETVNGVTQYILIIPTIVIPATRDALVGRTARYTARFYRTGTTTVIKAWGGYESFALASTPTTTTWGAVALSNQNGGPPVLGDNVAYSRDETRSLLNSIGGYTNSTAFTIGAATSPAAGNFDIRAGSGNNVPTVRYSSGAGCWQSSTDGVSFTCLGAGSGSGTVSAGTTNQLAYYSLNGTTVQGLGLGAGLSIGGGTLNVTFPTASGLQQAINAKTDFGCVANGSTDDTSCLTNAIAAGLASTGKKVQLPAGNYRVTGITVPGGVTLEGDGMRKTIISSVTNGIIVNAVEGSGFYQFTGPTIRNLMIQGSKTAGGSQIGLKADDVVGPDLYYAQALFENIQIYQAGSHGFYAGNTFSHRAINIYSDDNAGYPFTINSANMPSNHYESLYAQGTNASANAGFRIMAGNFICISCNGINQSAAGSWNAILGQSIAQGDAANVSAFAQWQNTNFESAKAGGIDHRYNSVSTFSGHNQFAGDSASSGSYIAMRYEIDTAIFPPFFAKGTINDSVVFANSPVSFYTNSQPIHANALPPLTIDGQGPKVAGGNAISTFRNTTTGTAQQLYRSDAYSPTVAVTATTSFPYPGAKYFEVTCASDCPFTLPWPGWYAPGGEQIIVKNLSNSGIVVTLAANGGGSVNTPNGYTMTEKYQSVTLMPDATALDYRVISKSYPGVATRIPVWTDTVNQTTISGLGWDAGSSVFTSPGRFWGADTSAGAPTFAFSSDLDTGFYKSADGKMGFASNGGEKLRLQGNGLALLGNRLTWDIAETVFDLAGNNSPEGSVTAGIGSTYRQLNGGQGTTLWVKESGTSNSGWVQHGQPTPKTFSTLGTPANGVIYYCSDCVKGGNPCAGAGTGAIAQRLNSVWRCD